jgi:dipeptidyl aminopeptidase/acylaminoacyl peptidase
MPIPNRQLSLITLSFIFFVSLAVGQQKRPIAPIDVYRLQTISDLQVSPDGNWVAYVLSSVDTTKDRRTSDIWMVSWDGTQNIQLTNSPESESRPRFSPDGKYLSFVAKRGEERNNQIYLLDRRGGEASKLTNLKVDVGEYVWSPDASHILLTLKDPDVSDTTKNKARAPYVIDRYHFKQDGEGYLDRRATHLYLFDVATKKLDTLTTGHYNELRPVFSPDGLRIVFVSNRTDEPDKNQNTDLFVMDAKPGAEMKRLTSWRGGDDNPVWSPDGKFIAYLQTSSDEPFTMYGQQYLAVISAEGGTPRLLSKSVDRPFSNPHWSNDGQAIYGILRDDRQALVVSFRAAGGELTRVADGERVFSNLEPNRAKHAWVALMSTPYHPAEIYALEQGGLRKITGIHDAFLASVQLATVEGFQSRSKDGTIVSSILFRPPDAVANQKLPLVLYIHGGPVAQDEYGFDLTRQIFACAGYAVVGVNYRGSSGRGIAYTRAIYGDWGNKEVVDIVGAVDYLIKQGIVDENRMGIAGWSYGGILTNYVIATDQRFKAAVSGAGSSLQLTMYGTDQYIVQYETELGPPWKNPDAWLKVSYPFFKAERIKTPTLFMASQNDFNVPVAGAEQMYQALRSLGVPTELVIYPNQNHGLTVPSYIKDRLERHIAWWRKFLR